MKTYIAIAVFLFSSTLFSRGQNMVPNPSFELGPCPGDYLGVLPTSWSIPLTHTGTPDYFKTCAMPYAFGVPFNFVGNQFPADGNAYIGLLFYSGREYLQAQLTSPLVSGHIYHFSVQCSYEALFTAIDPPIITNSLGIYLSATPVVSSLNPIPVVPQYQPFMAVTSTDWTEIGFDYTAQGGENYILIGNFKDDLETIILPPTGSQCYFYVDDVSGTPVGIGNTLICSGESTTLTAFGSTTYAWANSVAPNVILSNNASITVSPSDTTMYYVYKDTDTVSITVYVKPITDVYLGNDTIICDNENILLTAYQAGSHVAGTQYVWQNGAAGPFFTPTQTGTYSVTANLNGCTASDTIQVTFNPVPYVNLGPDVVLCPGQTVTLNAAQPWVTYQWQDQSTAPTFFVNQGGTYYVTVGLANCTASDTVIVTDVPNPVFDLGNDTGFCIGNSIVLDASIPNGYYRWSDNSTAPIFTLTQEGIYWVEVTLGTCTLADSIDIIVYPLPTVNLGNDSMACIGSTVLLDATAPGLTYQWQDASPLPTYTVSQSGMYSVQVTDSNHCQNSDSVQVTFISPPVVDFEDSTLCFGDVWVLDISASYATYLWPDKSVLPTFTITHEGTYWAIASNACGSDADSMEVNFRRCNCNVYIPNSFTPDQNSTNETFRAIPNEECELKEYTLSIFDRWGHCIFETQDAGYGWNGAINGNRAQIGVYTYRLRYKFDKTPQEMLWGKVSLVR